MPYHLPIVWSTPSEVCSLVYSCSVAKQGALPKKVIITEML